VAAVAVQLTETRRRVFEAIFQFPALDKMHQTFHTLSAIAVNHPGKCSMALRNQSALETHRAL
jgi:hypothetical protein